MVTDASKAILRSKIVLTKELIDEQNRLIATIDTEISVLQNRKSSHIYIKQQAQNDLRDLKADTGDA
jgi:hypothetical protein